MRLQRVPDLEQLVDRRRSRPAVFSRGARPGPPIASSDQGYAWGRQAHYEEMNVTAFTWVSVAQPLYVARTGVARADLGSKPSKTEDAWHDTLEAAQSGLDTFCKPERVYALGLNEAAGHDYGPAYLTASGVYHDTGAKDSEVYMTGDDPATTEALAREWVSGWVQRAQTRLSELNTD
jgi:hypothetical protein